MFKKNRNQIKFGPIDIFRPGKFKPMKGAEVEYSESDVQHIANNYDPENAPAPVVIGHPKTDAPAYGWVESLSIVNGKLQANVKDASVSFAELVKNGSYKKVSASFFKPDASNNPVPGTWYLKHVGFLGATAPAVSGLTPVSFSEGDEVLEFEFSEENSTSEFAAMESELLELRKEKQVTKIDTLIDEGKLLPVFKDEVLEFSASLDNAQTFEFSEGEAQTRQDWFMSFLTRLPKIVEFGQVDLGDEVGQPTPATLIVPNGYEVDPKSVETYEQTKKIASEKGVSFSEAVDIVARS
jgi:hypothetical protein